MEELHPVLDLFFYLASKVKVPFRNGFFCEDTSIRYPYSPDTFASIFYILSLAVPFMFICCVIFLKRLPISRSSSGNESTEQQMKQKSVGFFWHGWGFTSGIALTLVFTWLVKLATGRLAPNFFDACKPDGYGGMFTGPKAYQYISEFDCTHPDRQLEVSRSFPCMFASLSSYGYTYALLFWFSSRPVGGPVGSPPAPTPVVQAFAVILGLSAPVIISILRVNDFRSHPTDAVAGLLLGAVVALVMGGQGLLAPRRKIALVKRGTNAKTPNAGQPKQPGTKARPCVGVCTSAVRDNVEGFIRDLRTELADVDAKVVFMPLPYNSLDDLDVKRWSQKDVDEVVDVLILCHSINNRRLSLTDVTDALYEKFIPKASKIFGKDSFIVVAHDFKWSCNDEKSRKSQDQATRLKQPTVYKHAAAVILAGSLSKDKYPVAVIQSDWDVIRASVSKSLPQ